MEKNMTLGEVVKELGESLQLTTTSLSEVSVNSDLSTIKIGEDKYVLDDVALKSLSRHLGIQPGYIVKCPDDLAKANIDYWLEEYGESTSVFQSYDGDLERVFTEKDSPIRPDYILAGLERDYLQVVDFQRTYDKTVVDVLSGQAVESWHIGVRLTLNTSAKRKSYVELLGRNEEDGAVFVMEVPKGRISQDKKSKSEVREEVKEAFEQALGFYKVVPEKFKSLREEKLEGTYSMIVEELLEKSRISKSAQKNLLQDILVDIEGTVANYYDVMKSLAQNAGTLTTSRVPAEEMAGKIYKGVRAEETKAYTLVFRDENAGVKS